MLRGIAVQQALRLVTVRYTAMHFIDRNSRFFDIIGHSVSLLQKAYTT